MYKLCLWNLEEFTWNLKFYNDDSQTMFQDGEPPMIFNFFIP